MHKLVNIQVNNLLLSAIMHTNINEHAQSSSFLHPAPVQCVFALSKLAKGAYLGWTLMLSYGEELLTQCKGEINCSPVSLHWPIKDEDQLLISILAAGRVAQRQISR